MTASGCSNINSSELANETVNYDTEIKTYHFEPGV